MVQLMLIVSPDVGISTLKGIGHIGAGVISRCIGEPDKSKIFSIQPC
jgi:hypothetical protein